MKIDPAPLGMDFADGSTVLRLAYGEDGGPGPCCESCGARRGRRHAFWPCPQEMCPRCLRRLGAGCQCFNFARRTLDPSPAKQQGTADLLPDDLVVTPSEQAGVRQVVDNFEQVTA